MIKEILLNFGSIFCDLMSTAIFIQILLSWFVRPDHRVYELLDSMTRPVMKLAKSITPKTGMFDLSPIIALFGLEIAKAMWVYLFSMI